MKKDQINNWLNSPIHESDKFWVGDKQYIALGLRGKEMICAQLIPEPINDYKDKTRITIEPSDSKIVKKAEDYEGVNPFISNTIRFSAFGLESIFTMIGYDRRERKNKEDGLDMPYFNWNPYFIINGEKQHYQRGYIWNLSQKQALINTIYRGLEAGRIIIHHHSWEKQEKMVKAGYKDFASRDIVDGKQRLSTIIEFIEDKFEDEFGNVYSDLSKSAQRKFNEYQGLLYGEMDSNCSDKQICDAFLNNACQGTPISIEHIEYINNIRKQLI